MTIMTRIIQLCKADIHGLMDQFEDRRLLLRQYQREMEESLYHTEDSLSRLGACQQQLEHDLVMRQQEIDKLEEDITQALLQKRDDIAKMLLRKKRLQQKYCEQLHQQLNTVTREQDELHELLKARRLRYQQLKARADLLLRDEGHATGDQGCGETFAQDYFLQGDEDEIELELLRRKEQFSNSRGAENE
jgi:phage shock protein A